MKFSSRPALCYTLAVFSTVMANFFSKLFGHKSTSVVGIDIGSSSIKVVQLSRRGGQAILETYGELSLGPYANTEIGRATNLPPEKISEALNDVIRESKVTTRVSGISIPFGSSLITPIEMPAVPEKQMIQMIPIEARKYIPVPINEVVLDWWVIPKFTDRAVAFNEEEEKTKQGDKTDVLLVAIHNETLTKYQTIITQSALDASFFEIEIFSAIRSLADQDVTSLMVIDLGAASSKMYIIERGVVRSSHVVNRGAQDITMAISKSLGVSIQEAEVLKRDPSQIPADKKAEVESVIAVTLDYIFSEAHRVMLSYQQKYSKDVPKAIIVGGGAMMQGALSHALSNLNTEVSLGDPFSKTEAPAFLANILKTTGPEFAVAVGVALRRLSEVQ